MATCNYSTCHQQLRSNNKSGFCPDHKYQWQRNGEAASPRAASSSSSSQKKNAEELENGDAEARENLRKQFAQLAFGLGEDAETLIDGFIEGWIETARTGAKKALSGEDD